MSAFIAKLLTNFVSGKAFQVHPKLTWIFRRGLENGWKQKGLARKILRSDFVVNSDSVRLLKTVNLNLPLIY